jgi:hypothetical protein
MGRDDGVASKQDLVIQVRGQNLAIGPGTPVALAGAALQAVAGGNEGADAMPGLDEPFRSQAAWVTDADIRAMAAEYAPAEKVRPLRADAA